jgi:hypothetical protein
MVLANSINGLFSNSDAFGNLANTTPTPIILLQFPYTLNPELVRTTLTGSGTATHSAPFAVCSTTAAINSSAQITTLNNLHYNPGQGGLVLFTALFTTGVVGSSQEVGLGDAVNGLFFGYSGATFGITRRANSSDTFIPQSTWNKDKMDGTGTSRIILNPTLGNVYKIQYQWLGFGNINFFIEDASTGIFVLVHQIQYPNTSTATTLFNPTLPLFFKATNTTNNTNIVLRVPSMGAYVEGSTEDLGVLFSTSNTKSVTTLLNIFTIRSKALFNSITNRKLVSPVFLSLSNTSTADGVFSLYLNATLGGVPSYTDISLASSVVDFDVAGTTITGGRRVASFYVNTDGNAQIDLNNLPLIVNPTDTLTVGATSNGAAISASAALTWSEQF